MRVFHDTRDAAYRSPFGAVAASTQVELAVDVWDAPDATVKLRTWVDGEVLYDMQPEEREGFVRYRTILVPDEAGIVWYFFVITDAQGHTMRYGAAEGRTSGTGVLQEWEPPSFQLSVYDERADYPAWYAPVIDFLQSSLVSFDAEEMLEMLREHYPFGLCRTVLPWDGQESALPLEFADEGAGRSRLVGYWAQDESDVRMCVLMNASMSEACDVLVPMGNQHVAELVSGYGVRVVTADELDEETGRFVRLAGEGDRFARVRLRPLGAAALHFYEEERLAAAMEPGLGVLAHITSLPADEGDGLGTLGASARAFVDWLAAAGVRYWQVLPVSPTDEYGSPYAGISAFAGNVRLLPQSVLDEAPKFAKDNSKAYKAFCKREADWLEPYACFMALRQQQGQGVSWQEWPKKYRRFDAKTIKEDRALKDAAEECRQQQFAFDCAWAEMRAYANERGVRIIGDMPLYVSADSADVWAHPELFQLGDGGRPQVVAGCPPDAFAVDGQVWGNPVYDWDVARAEGFAWWLRRLRRAFDLYDFVRLDHFIGFSRYYAIPQGQPASEGAYHLGPGFALFDAARQAFGPLPIIAEDLGLITPAVRALVAACGFPGMDIVQFVDGNDPLAGYRPRPEKIAYTGTHDNQTLRGYVQGRYPGLDDVQTTKHLTDMVVACGAPVCVVPLQDVLLLDDEARMNVPGVAEGNWRWQAGAAQIDAAAERMKALVDLHSEQGF